MTRSLADDLEAYLKLHIMWPLSDALYALIARVRALEARRAQLEERVVEIEDGHRHWMRVATEAQEHLAAALVREQVAETALFDAQMTAAAFGSERNRLSQEVTAARRKALNEAIDAYWAGTSLSELLNEEPKA